MSVFTWVLLLLLSYILLRKRKKKHKCGIDKIVSPSIAISVFKTLNLFVVAAWEKEKEQIRSDQLSLKR